MCTADIAVYLPFDLYVPISFQVSVDIDVLVDDSALAAIVSGLSCPGNEVADFSSDGPYSIFCYRWHCAPAKFGVHSRRYTFLPPPHSSCFLSRKCVISAVPDQTWMIVFWLAQLRLLYQREMILGTVGLSATTAIAPQSTEDH